ncbi:helix-turn-helix domain-containing protein [Halomonas sp. WWR20]
MNALGNRIKQLRVEAGLSKAALARRVGVSDVTISYWESGTIKQIGHERLIALSEALECPLKNLLDSTSAAQVIPAPESLSPDNSQFLLHLSTQEPAPWLNGHTAPKLDGMDGYTSDAIQDQGLGGANSIRLRKAVRSIPRVGELLRHCYFVTPAPGEQFDFLGEGDIAAVCPISDLQHNGLYVIERLGKLEIRHIERLSSGRVRIREEGKKTYVIETEKQLSFRLLGCIEARWKLFDETLV